MQCITGVYEWRGKQEQAPTGDTTATQRVMEALWHSKMIWSGIAKQMGGGYEANTFIKYHIADQPLHKGHCKMKLIHSL